VGLRGEGGGAALAKVFRPTRCAGGKNKAKMAGGGDDVPMAAAAGATGSGANGAGSPAGRAGSGASVRTGSRRDGASADHGRDMHGGDYPDGAEDQEAEPPLIEGAGPSPFRRTYVSPPSLGTRDGVPVMSDDVLMDAATNNRRVALVRIEKDHSGVPPGFIDILNGVPEDHVDAVVAEVHGNANYGNQGKARQAYEVLAYANELVRYGRPFHDLHPRLYAWALLFPVHQMGTFEVAANTFGRLRRDWPEAVFLSRRTATEVSVPFAQEAGREEYLDELIEAARKAEHAVEETFDARTLALTSFFSGAEICPRPSAGSSCGSHLEPWAASHRSVFRCYPGASSFRLVAVVPTLPPLVVKPRGVDGDALRTVVYGSQAGRRVQCRLARRQRGVLLLPSGQMGAYPIDGQGLRLARCQGP